MNQLDRIEAKLDQLLAQRGEAPAVTSGVFVGDDGRQFLPGTGWTSPLPTEQPKAQPKPPGAGKEASAAAREALATTRKDLA